MALLFWNAQKEKYYSLLKYLKFFFNSQQVSADEIPTANEIRFVLKIVLKKIHNIID